MKDHHTIIVDGYGIYCTKREGTKSIKKSIKGEVTEKENFRSKIRL